MRLSAQHSFKRERKSTLKMHDCNGDYDHNCEGHFYPIEAGLTGWIMANTEDDTYQTGSVQLQYVPVSVIASVCRLCTANWASPSLSRRVMDIGECDLPRKTRLSPLPIHSTERATTTAHLRYDFAKRGKD
jgi:hypothetical protein